MAHVAKYTRSAVGSLSRHYERAKNKDGEYIKHKNQDIDYTRTHENYNLAPERNQLEFIKDRCTEANCLSRANINVMCDWVVTAPKDLPKEDEKKFFEESYKFLSARYGEKNVISAYVHKDENQPHMHFSFVPVGFDKKNDRETVSAKMVLNRGDLQTFHSDLSRHMEKAFGRDIGIVNEATKEGNKSIDELKRKSATERLQETTLKASEIVSKAQERVKAIQTTMKPLQAEYEAKKAYIRECDKSSDISMAIPEYAEVKEKGIFKKEEFVTVPKEKWLEKHVSANEKAYLESATKELEKVLSDFKRTTSAQYIQEITERVKSLERELLSVKTDKRMLESKVLKAEKETDKVIDRVNKVLGKLPDETADKFLEAWKKEKSLEQSRSFGHER